MAITDAILKNVVDTKLDTALFIQTATDFVGGQLGSTDLSSTTKESITLYFAAHLVVLSTEFGGLKRSRLGESDETYKAPGDKDTGLASTRFGQMVMLLDTSGTLAGLTSNKGITALFTLVDHGNREGYGDETGESTNYTDD